MKCDWSKSCDKRAIKKHTEEEKSKNESIEHAGLVGRHHVLDVDEGILPTVALKRL